MAEEGKKKDAVVGVILAVVILIAVLLVLARLRGPRPVDIEPPPPGQDRIDAIMDRLAEEGLDEAERARLEREVEEIMESNLPVLE